MSSKILKSDIQVIGLVQASSVQSCLNALCIPTRFIPGWASAFHFAFFSKLNIVNEKMYEVLSMVYQEFLELFDTDVFHMGGDEVNMNCYNTSKEIRDYLENDNKIGTEEDILDLWRTFQTKVCHILKSHSSGKLEVRCQKAI